MKLKKILAFSLIILAVSIIPSSFAWNGLMAMDADKRNVEYGEIIIYEGYLYDENLIDEELVYITIYEQETRKIISETSLAPSSTSVKYFENTAWTFKFKVDTLHQNFTDNMKYVVEAKYDDKSFKLDFLIKADTKANLEEKATEVGEAIVEAGTETGELVLKAGQEAGRIILEAGSEVVEKGTIVGEVVVEKSSEAGQVIVDKGAEGIEEIQEKGGGCLVATATYGSELAPQVQFLREIRDNTLLSTESGTSFMSGFNSLYYSFSPTVADYERENPAFREAIKLFITPMLSTLSIMTLADEGSESQVLGLGISVIVLNFGMYIIAPTLIIRKALSFKIRKFYKKLNLDYTR